MASYASKRELRRVLNQPEKPASRSIRKYLREMVQEDGPMRTERLLSTMLSHGHLSKDGFDHALPILAQETKANMRYLKRRFPDTWQTR